MTRRAALAVGRRLAAGVLLLGLALAPAAADPVDPADLAQLRAHALALVNLDRQSAGLPPLRATAVLDAAAQGHAQDMQRRGYYDHVTPDGRTVAQRYLAAGGSRWQLVAENIARCTGCSPTPTMETLRELEIGWMNSPAHRGNILDPGLDSFGFGIAAGPEQPLLAVQNFAGPGRPRDLAPGEAAQPLPADRLADAAAGFVNAARAVAGVPPLQPNPALSAAARVLLGEVGAELGPLGSAADALAPEERQNWRAFNTLAGVCGGCGVAPVTADLRYFQRRWLADPKYRKSLLDPALTDLGYALAADGQGRKVAVALLGRRR